MYTLIISYIDQKTGEARSAHFLYGTAAEAFQNYRYAIKKSEVQLAHIYHGGQRIFVWHKNIPY